MGEIEIKQIAKEAALEAIREVMFQKKDKRLHNTRLLMKNYNNLKEHINSESENIEIKVNFDDDVEIKSDYIWLESVVRSKARTAKMMQYVDEKINFLENKYNDKEEYEKFEAFKLFYIDEMTNEEIQDELFCGKNSVKKWRDLIINELSVLLWGIDAIGI